jgi:hypothetical protein
VLKLLRFSPHQFALSISHPVKKHAAGGGKPNSIRGSLEMPPTE